MRTLKLIIISLLLSVALGSCTTNNGDIGLWFGTWHLEKITIDGTEDSEYTGNVFWQFQTDVVDMLVVHPYHTAFDHWGTWAEHGEELTLNFDHAPVPDSGTLPSIFLPPVETHLPGGVLTLHIDKLTSSRLTVTYTNPDSGQTLTYTLRKR